MPCFPPCEPPGAIASRAHRPLPPNDELTSGLDVEAARTFTDWIEAAKSAHHRVTITRKD